MKFQAFELISVPAEKKKMKDLRGGLSLLFNHSKANEEDDIFEFQEEDVFCKPKEGHDSCSNSNLKTFGSALEPQFACAIPTVPRIILKANRGGGRGSDGGGCLEPTPTKLAAPHMSSHINIPDWTEIYQLNPNKEIWEATCYLEKALIAKRRQVRFFEDESGDGYGDDDDGEFIPPHIIVARRELATRRICHSMLEGIGRSLKGKELIKFRDSVWRLTGFID